MNIDNDYDNDGNNIVPCPICMSKYCPSKENGECPEEFSFALEGEIRLLLDEYKKTGDNSRIVNVLEAVDQQLQKAREEERERIIKIVNDLKQQWGGAIDLRSAEFAESETKRRIIKNIV